MAEPYDVAIFGATPAGWAAARVLAAKKCRTIVVRAANDDARCSLCDWVGQDFFAIKGLDKAMAAKAGAKAFREVLYHNADLTREVSSKSRATAGWFIHTEKLTKALASAAKAAGAKIWSPRAEPTIHLGEETVSLVGGKTIRARVLLLACKSPKEIANVLHLPMRFTAAASPVIAALDIPLRGSKRPPGSEALHAIELADKTQLGMFFTLDKTLHVRVICHSPGTDPGAALSTMIARLGDAELLPEQLDLAGATGSIWRPPAGAALEMDSHVAKRCLLMGTAGGFADATTGQTLTASVRSALLAAETVITSLATTNCQSSLMAFTDSWRATLADYIRPPNTSLALLLPLLFTNNHITTRFTAALLNGKNI